MKIEIVLPDNAPADLLVVEARRQWLLYHRQPGESLPTLARRLGISYRQARYWSMMIHRGAVLAPDAALEWQRSITPTTNAGCEFCAATESLHEHHVINRTESPITVWLCNSCHKTFHLLNNLYRRTAKP